MIRRAIAADLPGLLAFLRRDEAGSMFPLVNLAEEGLPSAGPQGMRVWLAEDATGICGMLGLTRTGALLVRWPGGLDGARQALAGETVAMMIGRGDQVTALRAAIGLGDVEARHAKEEPGFVLELEGLILPQSEGFTLVSLTGAYREAVLPWRAAYLAEVFAVPSAQATAQAGPEVDRWIARGSHRLLLRGGVPVSMSGFNAALPEVVQVGGVYTPPGLRGQGLARRVVALHLAEARAQGVQRAVLFAASDQAAAAYRAIGFRRHGTMRIVQFAAPVTVSAPGDLA